MKCSNDAAFRYTWPGRDESYVCQQHADKLQMVANAIGLYVQLIPVPYGQAKCMQEVSEKEVTP